MYNLQNMIEARFRNGNGSRGPISWPVTAKDGTTYIADIYNKGSYRGEQTGLAEQSKLMVARANLWTPDVANTRINAIVDMVDPDYTSWIGFRKPESPRNEYEGCAWQTEIDIPIPGGSMRLLWMLIRALKPDAQKLHLGRESMKLSYLSHPEATHMGHRTGSVAAVLSWLEGPLRRGTRAPYDINFDEIVGYRIALPVLYELTHVNGLHPNRKTGVSAREYGGATTAYKHDPSHTRATEVLNWMTASEDTEVEVLGKKRSGLEMDLGEGAALFEIGELEMAA